MVTVEVPVHAPTIVPIESESSASFIWGILPSLSSMPARAAVPTNVPMVSNMSIMQNVTISVIAVNHPSSKNPAKLNLNSVRLTISPNGGTHDAVVRLSNGLSPKNSASPAQ